MPKQGGLSPLTWESCSPESEACFCSPIFFFYLRSTSAATRSLRTLHLARDVMQLHVYLVPHGRHNLAGIHSLLPDPDYTCSHDVTLRIPKSKPRSPRGSPREQICSARRSFTNTLAWRTRPVQIHLPSLAFVCPRDRLTSTAGVPGRGFTPANEHVGVSCQARSEPRARHRVNPARSPLQLQPLLGSCLLSDAVVVSIPPTHTCVSRH